MRGVNHVAQMASLYDLDKKSLKWWKELLYWLLMFAAVNAWIIFHQLHLDGRTSHMELEGVIHHVQSNGDKNQEVKDCWSMHV